MLIDPDIKHKYADIAKITKYQQALYSSYNSKVVLQETVLGIAEFIASLVIRIFLLGWIKKVDCIVLLII